MSSSGRRSRLAPKLGRVFPTKITPKDRLLSMTHWCGGNDKRSVPRFDGAYGFVESQGINQTHKGQKSRRPLLTGNLSAKLIEGVASSGMLGSILHKKNAGDFLSVPVSKAKFSKRKKTLLKYRGRRAADAEGKNRLAQEEKLALFQNLRREPLTYLELHSRFGVSKQTLGSLLRTGVLEEVWGKNGVGLRFTITGAFRERLKRLEENARYSPRIRKVAGFRLNQRIVP